MTFEARLTRPDDIEEIVTMLRGHWTAQGWSRAKYAHYYEHYPDGAPLSFVGTYEGDIVAFLGLLPITISGMKAYLVLHVFVRPTHRRGRSLIDLIRFAETTAQERDARFLCGFGNIRFATVAARLLKWKIPGYLVFGDRAEVDLTPYKDRFAFEYGEAWYEWKLGNAEETYVRDYEKDGRTLHQLLKTRTRTRLALGKPLNLWHPEDYQTTRPEGWSQPFCLAPLTDLPQGLDDIRRWYIEMGDSDTFEPHQPWR